MITALWATARYLSDDGTEYTAPALVVVVVSASGGPPRPVAWDLSERRPKRCDSWSNFVGMA